MSLETFSKEGTSGKSKELKPPDACWVIERRRSSAGMDFRVFSRRRPRNELSQSGVGVRSECCRVSPGLPVPRGSFPECTSPPVGGT